MGTCSSKANSNGKIINTINLFPNPILQPTIPANSNKPTQTANKTELTASSLKPILTVQNRTCIPKNYQLIEIQQKAFTDTNQKIKIKVPINVERTKFIWKQQESIIYPPQIKNLHISILKNAKFQQKLSWFRLRLQSNRISWEQGSEVLKVDRLNILFSSLQNLKNLNLYKQIKVQFTDEKVDDAGGLLRQWMHLCIKQIMQQSTGIFKICDTDETAYKFVWDKNVVEDLAIQTISLLGFIIGKAIFERISLNCYLNHTILRQLCSQPIHIEDVYNYDKNFYSSWLDILKTNDIESMYLDGCAYHTHGQSELQQIQLFPNGKNTMINNTNRQLFISQMIQLHCTKSVLLYIQALKQSLFKVIPSELLSIFEPYEFEMMLNGPLFIDVKDWRNHTNYEELQITDDVAKWFWEVVQKYDQQSLRILLHYCTGSLRVPILGFKYLQSNRGEIKPFTLRLIPYTGKNPYPKSHTCFNRLQIPKYKSKQELRERLKIISSQQFNHFGLN